MRGKVTANEEKNELVGITPAHAGKSVQHGFPRLLKQDHPRTCGEKT